MPEDKDNKGPSDEERNVESSKAAQQSIDAANKAKELTQAAAGAGDPQERQKLLNEALEQEIASESFGKTAKYMQSGTFQGMAAGTGIGVGTGAGVGTLSGVLVGGVTSTITGGLGGAVGSGVGALHGPFVKMGDVAGEGIAKVTGDLPGWEVTDEQKGALEKMVGQVNETERPGEDELQALTKGAGGGGGSEEKDAAPDEDEGQTKDDGEQAKGSWTESASSYLPSMGSSEKSGEGGKEEGTQEQQKSWSESASSYMPSMSSSEKSSGGEDKASGQEQQQTWSESASSYVPSKDSMPSMPSWGSKGEDKPATDGNAQQSGEQDEQTDDESRAQVQGGKQDAGFSKETTYQGKGGADPSAVDALKNKLG